MLADLLAILWAPFLMCLVLTGIHAYLGVHVLAREVVFVDIAMAQIAALGATAAFLLGYDTETWQSYALRAGRHARWAPSSWRSPGAGAGTSRRRR